MVSVCSSLLKTDENWLLRMLAFLLLSEWVKLVVSCNGATPVMSVLIPLMNPQNLLGFDFESGLMMFLMYELYADLHADLDTFFRWWYLWMSLSFLVRLAFQKLRFLHREALFTLRLTHGYEYLGDDILDGTCCSCRPNMLDLMKSQFFSTGLQIVKSARKLVVMVRQSSFTASRSTLFQRYILCWTGLDLLTDALDVTYTISWSPTPGAGLHLSTSDSLFVMKRSSVVFLRVGKSTIWSNAQSNMWVSCLIDSFVDFLLLCWHNVDKLRECH